MVPPPVTPGQGGPQTPVNNVGTPVAGGQGQPVRPMVNSAGQNGAVAGGTAGAGGAVRPPGTPTAGPAGGAGAPGQPPQPGQPLPLVDLNRIVLEYLNKKGYSRTEAMLRMESSRIPAPPANNVGPNGGVRTGPMGRPGQQTPDMGAAGAAGTGKPVIAAPSEPPEAYVAAYRALKNWTDRSLDLYRPELRRILYPVFVHIFLELISKDHGAIAKDFFDEYSQDQAVVHSQDIEKLSAISLPSHVKENELAKAFLEQEYKLTVSRTSLDLLLYFVYEIEQSGGSIIIRLLNQYMDIQVTSARPSITDTESVLNPDEGLIGIHGTGRGTGQSTSGGGSGGSGGAGGAAAVAAQQSQIDSFNSQPLKLGHLPMDADFQKDVTTALEEKDKQLAASGDEAANAAVGTTGYKTLSEEFAAQIKQQESESGKNAPTRESLPLPKYKSVDVELEVKKIIDSRAKIHLGTTQTPLPSVCMYTFHNTHDGLNCLDFSDDSSLVAGGFSDSFVKVWSLKGDKLSSVVKDDVPSTSKRLIGHSGPVFGTSFSSDNRYLLSCSEDNTARLWSLDTYSALVSYKGHNHPVWDVKFGPYNHYFATASHDHTARLWSCDHIYPLRIFAGHLSDVDTVSFHPNGTYVFTGSSDKTCRMWDINKGSAVRVFIGHTGAVNTTAVSPDGRWLATAGEDSVINVWDIGSGRRLKSMKGHGRTSIYSLAFSRDGAVLVSGGADHSVRTWDIRKGTHDGGPEPEVFKNESKTANIPDPSTADPASGDRKKTKEVVATSDHLAVYHTKRTPVYKVAFTRRNLCLAGGAFSN
ncbi:Taf5p [Sugiyamaella lignohabitans]|uniref:Taf5p n=1 Tax=Sugiyamaella lignohabitans TaxID=796027 RepID=A0A167EJ71_9ASCO|nr:Taf5p [Sugiyamaella lignohabitans]ANB14143.1 Taf5p [Sugiyamaella lignohabitans]